MFEIVSTLEVPFINLPQVAHVSQARETRLAAPINKYNVSHGTFLSLVRDKKLESIQLERNHNKVTFLEKEETRLGQANVMFSEDVMYDINHSGADITVNDSFLLSRMPLIYWALFSIVASVVFLKNRPNVPSMKKRSVTDRPRVHFEDIAGVDEVRSEILEVVDFLKHPDKYDRVNAKVPKGCLLVGPPGVGKTMLAKAMAYEADVPFFACSGSEFVEVFVGVGAAKVRELFSTARKHAPCIVYIDEIDAVGKKRSSGGMMSHDEREQTLNQLLVELDGIVTNQKVMVLASTNREDILDDALIRPGRFDRKIRLRLPNQVERSSILQVHLKDKPIDDTIQVDQLARMTSGCSGADLAGLVNEAAIVAARKNESKITMSDLDEALDRMLIGIKQTHVSHKQEWTSAVHEIGHVLASLYLTTVYDSLTKVSIEARGDAGGVTMFAGKEDATMLSRQYLLESIVVALGGRAAEEVLFGKEFVTTGAVRDIEVATETARAMVTQFGFCDSLGKVKWNSSKTSEEYAAMIDQSVHQIISDRYEMCITMMRHKKCLVEGLAKELLLKKTLNSEEIRNMIEILQYVNIQ